MKILVTGGAGFIGSHIVDLLVERGDDVVIIDNLSTGKNEQLHPQATFHACDITDPSFEQIVYQEQPEVVIHQAAQTRVPVSVSEPVHDAYTNILGTINVLEACRKSGVRKVVFASSAAVYGDPDYLPIDEKHPIQPLSGYGIGKHTGEHYLHVYHQMYDLDYTILRYANVYGIRQDAQGEGGVVSIFIDKFLRNQAITIFGDGEQTRDYVYVEDIARANVAAIDRGGQQIVNIGTGVSTSLNELVQLLERVSGKKAEIEYKDPRFGDIKDSAFHHNKAKSVLNWAPDIPLIAGLKRTYQYYFSPILEKTL